MGCAQSSQPASLDQGPSGGTTKQFCWIFDWRYPTRRRNLGCISIFWPASIEIFFTLCGLQNGGPCLSIFKIGICIGAPSECCLYTNCGGPHDPLHSGGLGWLVSGRKYLRESPEWPELVNGDKVHTVLTVDDKGNGKMWTNGELVADKPATCEGSNPNAPILPIRDLPVSVSNAGSVEVHKLAIRPGVMSESQVKKLHAQAMAGTSRIGGSTLTRIRDARTLNYLREALRTTPEWLGKGRDVATLPMAEVGDDNAGAASLDYNALQLVCAWRVSHNLEERRYNLAKAEMKEGLSTLGQSPSFRLRTADWGREVLGRHYDAEVNEQVVLHGTRPEVLAQMLASGLNERFSVNGAFGVGIYLAEDAGKADQYCHPDPGLEHVELSSLHRALYNGLAEDAEHPGGVCYMLVCSLLMGAPAVTSDGDTKQGGGELWANAATRRELGPVAGSNPSFAHHSLLVETGQAVKRYQELVAFNSDRVLITHLLAYRRMTTLEKGVQAQ